MVAELVLSDAPLEATALDVEPSIHSSSVIEARLVSHPSTSVSLTSVTMPPRAHADRPLEIALAFTSSRPDPEAASSFARCIAGRGLVSLVIEATGVPRAVPLSVRPSGRGWIARALIDPASWADATSVTMESISLAGWLLACDCLPATVRVGYNHAAVLGKAVRNFASGRAYLPELKAALIAGGLTDDVDEVRRECGG